MKDRLKTITKSIMDAYKDGRFTQDEVARAIREKMDITMIVKEALRQAEVETEKNILLKDATITRNAETLHRRIMYQARQEAARNDLSALSIETDDDTREYAIGTISACHRVVYTDEVKKPTNDVFKWLLKNLNPPVKSDDDWKRLIDESGDLWQPYKNTAVENFVSDYVIVCMDVFSRNHKRAESEPAKHL